MRRTNGERTVKLILLSEASIRVEPTPGPLTVDAAEDGLTFSPFHMMSAGLAICTLSALLHWGATAGLDTDDITVEVAWTFAENPYRIGSFDLRFNWPALPPNRLAAAERVADLCTIHATFLHPPEMRTVGTIGPPIVSDREQADGVEPVIAS